MTDYDIWRIRSFDIGSSVADSLHGSNFGCPGKTCCRR